MWTRPMWIGKARLLGIVDYDDDFDVSYAAYNDDDYDDDPFGCV